MARRRLNPRKLLVASIGVATVSYMGLAPAACSSDDDDTASENDPVMGTGGTLPVPTGPGPTTANLVAPPPQDASQGTGGTGADAVAPPPTVANLVAPPPTVANLVAPPPTDAGPTVIRLDATIANLVAPPPFDSGTN